MQQKYVYLHSIKKKFQGNGGSEVFDLQIICNLFVRLRGMFQQLLFISLLHMKNQENRGDKPVQQSGNKEDNERSRKTEKGSHRFRLQGAFNANDSKQQYYNEIVDSPLDELPIQKIGWKIADLESDEEELALKCCNLLSYGLFFPVLTYTNLIEYDENNKEGKYPIKCLWLQSALHVSSCSKQFNNKGSFPQDRPRQFCEKVLLPLLQNFIHTNIRWEQMMKKGLNQYKILELFEQDVINKANEWIVTFYPQNTG